MRRPRATSSIVTILLGAVLGQGLVVAVSPMLTRLYEPTDFGLLQVVTAIASVLGAGATMGTDRALHVARDDTVRTLLLIGVVSTLCIATGAALATWWARDALAERFSAPTFADLWWVVPVTSVAVAFQRLVTAALARGQRHTSIAIRNVCQGVGQTVWNLGMAWTGALGLAGGLAAGRFAALLGTFRRDALRAERQRSSVRTTLSVHGRFFWISPWSSVLNVIGQQAPGVLIAATHGSATAGLVALTMRVLGSPVGMVADAVAQSVAGALGRQVRADEPVGRPLRRVVGRLMVLGIVAAVVVMVSGPTVFGAVFGPGWVRSGEYARILVPAFAMQVAVSPVSQVLGMLGRQSWQLAWDAGRLILTCGAVLVPSLLGASVESMLASLSVAITVSYLVMLGMVIAAVRAVRA